MVAIMNFATFFRPLLVIVAAALLPAMAVAFGPQTLDFLCRCPPRLRHGDWLCRRRPHQPGDDLLAVAEKSVNPRHSLGTA